MFYLFHGFEQRWWGGCSWCGNLELVVNLLNSKRFLLSFCFWLSPLSLQVVTNFSRVFLTGLGFECMEKLRFIFGECLRLVAEILLYHSMCVRALPVSLLEHGFLQRMVPPDEIVGPILLFDGILELRVFARTCIFKSWYFLRLIHKFLF